jgi:hypothetical protein
MNLYNIINEIEKVDPEVYDRFNDRRKALKQFTGFAGKVALVSMPFMLGSMFKKAYGQTTASVTDVLNFALTLEYLEAEFYTKGVAAPNLIAAGDVAGFTIIRDHENAHVNFLKAAISAAGATPVAKPNFDFTAGSGSMTGPYADVFTNYSTFLAVSQAFEDTGVRAYKGQAGNLMSNKPVLQAALQIHSVEARHASHVRYVRQQKGAAVKPWITNADPGGVPSIAPVYAGEDNTTQLTIQITGINGTAVSAAAASEAFDEPLTKEQVLAIVKPFIY